VTGLEDIRAEWQISLSLVLLLARGQFELMILAFYN